MNSLEKYIMDNPGFQEERLGIATTGKLPIKWTETRSDEQFEDPKQLKLDL